MGVHRKKGLTLPRGGCRFPPAMDITWAPFTLRESAAPERTRESQREAD